MSEVTNNNGGKTNTNGNNTPSGGQPRDATRGPYNQNQKPTVYTNKFKGENEKITTLTAMGERKAKDQFVVFIKSISQHVMTAFSNPGGIIPVIRDLVDPMAHLMKQIPIRETMESIGMNIKTNSQFPDTDVSTGSNHGTDSPSVVMSNETGNNVRLATPEETQMQESLRRLYDEDMKVFAVRRGILR